MNLVADASKHGSTEGTAPLDHRILAGALDAGALGSLIACSTAVKASDGDFREWGAIDTWADEIGRALDGAASR